MKRTKLADRVLPDYTLGEEIFNAVSHGIGAVFGIVALVLCIHLSVSHESPMAVVASSIYGSSVILLYLMSTIYHALKPNMAKKVFQVIDHCTIYFLIAGSYTPVLLTSVCKVNPWLGWTIFCIVWGISLLAIVLTAIDLDRYDIFSMCCYIGLGWCIIVAPKVLYDAIGRSGFILLLTGGIVYTIGAVLYGIGSRVRYMHSVFHLFVVGGTVLQFCSIYCYAI